ncbi:alkane 1-monooxygenase [Flavobacterium sp. 28A]|uniref:alkane 1-monooxygenase n=1 Tax=Flavobacterium sp. 28A TaxID=2735895 RepID=UPI00156EFABB|nr:alkane 1-monooxygenase [Flavobacterium sp. 28A]NRT14853.1 alkane 1-monooxygenase [Flavobacterium sp. 28A]
MKYLGAYILPLLAALGIYSLGFYTWLTPVFTFGLLPILEQYLPKDSQNYDEEEKISRGKKVLYDIMLYVNVLFIFSLLYFAQLTLLTKNIPLWQWIGLVFSVGIVLGSNGINVAHELGHRNKKFERILAKILLLPSFYTHFFIEHNHGHHLNVATPEDPSTARKNQNIYAFWVQTVSGTYTQAWQIQNNLNKRNNTSFWSINNDMLWFQLMHVLYLLLTFILFSIQGLLFAVFAGFVGLLLLETINYIEHYGLERKKLASGRYERVSELHSWNSNHSAGRIILYELTRHSDHHFKATKKYQILEHKDQSPKLPYGYPCSMVMALVPPLWFSVMNKEVPVNS